MDNIAVNKLWQAAYDPHVPISLEYPNISINQLFEASLSKFGQQPFLHFGDARFTYSQIGDFANRFKTFMIQKGLEKGERVGLALSNIPQFIISYYGVLQAGGVVVAMNPRYTKNEFITIIEQSGVRTVVCLESHKEIFYDLLCDEIITQLIITKNDDLTEIKKPLKRYQESRENEIDFVEIINNKNLTNDQTEVNVKPNDAAIFQFSGGTTGSPKPAIGMHRNIVANSIQFSRWCDLIEGKEVVLAAIPLYHVYGMVLALNMGMAIGASIVLIDDPTNIENILTQIESRQITFYPGVPTMYHAINQNPNVQNGKFNLTSIKACISGSFTLHPEIKRSFERITGGKLIEGYGLSEAPTATHCNPLYGVNKEGSIGLPLPDVEAKIVDVDDGEKSLGVDTAGELIIRGPQVMKGYFGQEEETEKVIRDGWLYTGDIATMDKDGYFFLVDRKKSLIKINGLQVWPNEVESVIQSHPAIKACAVGGVPDPVKGERVICWIVLKTDALLEVKTLQDWCRVKLSAYKIPEEFIVTEQIPRSGVGKILRRYLIADYKENAGE